MQSLEMSPSVEHQPDTVSKATQTEDDWAEIRADVKKLVNAVQSLVPQPKPVEIEVSLQIQCSLWTRSNLIIMSNTLETIFCRPRGMDRQDAAYP